MVFRESYNRTYVKNGYFWGRIMFVCYYQCKMLVRCGSLSPLVTKIRNNLNYMCIFDLLLLKFPGNLLGASIFNRLK